MDEGQPLVILAVDDEPGVLALVRRCLDDRRITLVEASSGADALRLLPQDPKLDLLITDLRMPQMEGDELARQVCAMRPAVRVLYLTSHADRLFGTGTGTRLEPGVAYLDKPFTREGLREAVALLLFDSTTLQTTAPPADGDKIRHDFKNQLAVIRGFAEVLVNEAEAGDRRRQDFAEIHKAAETALGLLDRLYPDEAASAIKR